MKPSSGSEVELIPRRSAEASPQEEAVASAAENVANAVEPTVPARDCSNVAKTLVAALDAVLRGDVEAAKRLVASVTLLLEEKKPA